MTVQIGILLALACALATNLGFLLKHRGACAAPDVDWRHPLASGAALFRSKWFAIGMSVAVVAWVLHVGAMALAPLSLVQAVISGGLVFLTVLAERFFGCSVGRRQWFGVGFTALGLALLAVTLPHGGSDARYSLAAMVAFEAGLFAVGVLLVLSPKLCAPPPHLRGLLRTPRPPPSWARLTSITVSCSAPPPASSSASPTLPSRRSPGRSAATASPACCRRGSSPVSPRRSSLSSPQRAACRRARPFRSSRSRPP